MGSTCCTARKNENLSSRTAGDVLHRNTIYSPSWSFRRDNRRRVAGEIENISYALSPGFSGHSSTEIKGELSLERGSFASGRSPLRITVSPKSPIHEELVEGHLEASSDITNTNHGNIEDNSFKERKESHGVSDSSEPKIPVNENPSSSTQPRQITDSNNGLILGSESHGGSSDGWSMRTFTELVASSRRERLSFESDLSRSPSNIIDVRNCGICSKLLAEKMIVAVLACGHVYHGDCLEKMTQEEEQCDPSCPICLFGPKQLVKMTRKIRIAEEEMKSRRNKIFSSGCSQVKDSNDVRSKKAKTEMGGRVPFLRRHFSWGSRSMSLENKNYDRKGFWSRFH
ncbi:uncharacterized protein LOC124933062 [Impatiens glandulifera]|uniref:uncharacterized protein LOC124933062 n=1 Tax=Impatiens glandulifera TaxID=253017 RepID=UPI001FB0BD24|nr:uncharacterized protein LOC124933062 [Impatiens glandulifera]